MNNIAVIYKSAYGFTKKYADWVSEELGADLIDRNSVKANQLNNYDIIIYGGGIYASNISGVDLVAKKYIKHLIVFTVGLTNPITMDYSDIMKKTFPNFDIQPEKVFHFRGGIDYAKLGFMHRNLMKVLNKSVARKSDSEMSEIEKIIKETYGKQVDYTEKNDIKLIVEYVRNIE